MPDAHPFPWLPFNNRPFANRMELLQVPRHGSYLMLTRFDVNPGAPKNTIDPTPHPHLLPLLASQRSGSVSEDPGLYRIFELVEVPSRFAGTRTWYNETDLENSYSSDPANTPPGFRKYNNSLSRFRDPGKVNLNTISDVRVWKAVAHSIGLPLNGDFGATYHLEQMWGGMDRTRRGYDDSSVSIPVANNLNLVDTEPTQFANPFRSSSGGDLSPLPDPSIMANGSGKDATLMRTREGRTETLLDMGYAFNGRHNDANRNSVFRYQALQKLDDRTTTQSNVYAVWITLGYFEATPGAVPGGFRFGQELGADTGEVNRHRGFYIIDRSIPVGYQPGKKHNVDDTVVLQRFIE
jgi:hypothetical protein